MRLAKFGYWLSLLAVGGILIPSPISAAETVAQAAPQATDVTLDAEGSLAGRVVASQGQAVPGAGVVALGPGSPSGARRHGQRGAFPHRRPARRNLSVGGRPASDRFSCLDRGGGSARMRSIRRYW